MCLTQGHNTVPEVRIQPATLNLDEHFTTEPLCSLKERIIRKSYFGKRLANINNILKALNFIGHAKS